MEAVVLQPVGGELVEIRRLTRSTEGAGRGKADIVEQDDEHVGRALRRSQRFDWWVRRVGILRVVGGQADVRPVRDKCFVRA